MGRRKRDERRGFRRRDKRYDLRIHAKRRALERYGLVLNRHDLKKIARMIQAGSGVLLRRQSRTRTHREVEFQEVKIRLVYDSSRGEIVTFLPRENVLVVDGADGSGEEAK